MTRNQMIENLAEADRLINQNEVFIRFHETTGILSSYERRLNSRNRLTALARFWECAIAKDDNPLSIAEQTDIMMTKIHNRIYGT